MHGSFQGFSISLLIIAWYVVAEVLLSRIVAHCHMKLPSLYIKIIIAQLKQRLIIIRT